MAVALFTTWCGSSTAAADGQPVAGFGVDGVMSDASFSGGMNVRPGQVVQLADGSFVVRGFLQVPGQVTVQEFIARYTSSGRPDTLFGNNGVIVVPSVVDDLIPMADGRVILTAFSSIGGMAVLGADGSLTPLAVQLSPGQLVPRPDGAIYAMGDRGRGGRVASLIRPDGSLDRAFNSDVSGLLPPGSRLGASVIAYSPPNATLLSDGRLIVAFTYSTPAPTHVFCGLVALLDDGRPDAAFGSNGLVSLPQPLCRLDHFADDTIRVSGDFADPVLTFSPNGTTLGAVTAPLDAPDLASNGAGGFYLRSGPGSILAVDPFGNLDPTFGDAGLATLPDVTIDGFTLLDSGNIVTWGNPVGDPTALALGLIRASIGTAPRPPVTDTAKFVPVTPARVLDTREGVGAPAGVVGPGGQIDLQITGRGGVPDTQISAVVLNVTATEATRSGYVSVFPAGGRRPTVSNLNIDSPGQTTANLVTVAVGTNGRVTLFSSGGTHLVADVAGYYTAATTPADGRLQTTSPQRILDTREGLGAPQRTVPIGGQVDLQVTGRGPVPRSGVSAVVLNITGDRASGDGYVTVWPAGTDRPLASNLNLVAGGTRANLVIVPVGPTGAVSLFTSGGADLIADVAGWFTDSTVAASGAGLFVPINPTRVLDTRHEPQVPTARQSTWSQQIGSTTLVPPNSTMAIAANITVTESGGAGFVTAWPAGTARPLASNLNTTGAGQTVPNAAIVPLGGDRLAVYIQSGAHLVIDINGWYTGP
jgi:hypothetical protein